MKNIELKNGDVINPNAKEENRNKNFLLRDIVKILLITASTSLYINSGHCIKKKPYSIPNKI